MESERNRKDKEDLISIKIKDELSKMKAELEKTRREKEELSQTLAAMDRTEDFMEARSSTMRDDQPSGNDTLLMRINNMSLGSLNIPECVPTMGDTELNKRVYDHWKNVFNASMNLIQATDESTKSDLFRIKAGPWLLELLDGTTTQTGMPDERTFPYSNYIARLDGYFSSRAYILSQRSKLANMVQKKGEANIEYVKRVAASSKLCNYKTDEEFEAISRTVTRGSTDSRVRTLAYRVLTDGGSINELIDQVRIREVELENEEDYRRLHHQRTATVAAISRQPSEGNYRRGQFDSARRYSSNRGGGRDGSNRGPIRNSRHSQACWRCWSAYHSPEDCFHRDKVCRNCDRRGHIARACQQVKQETQKRRWTGEESDLPSKVAAVQKVEDDKEQTQVVCLPPEEKENTPEVKTPDKKISEIDKVDTCVSDDSTAYVAAYVAGVKVTFFIDSGAQVNTITQESFDEILQDETARQCLVELSYVSDKPLRAYASEDSIEVVATFSAELFVSDERPVTVEKFYEVHETRALLGFNTATRYSLLAVGLGVQTGGTMDRAWPCEFSVNSILADKTSEFPKFNIPPVTLSYDKTMPPSRNVYTYIPAAFKELTLRRLTELQESGIIEKVTTGMDRSFCSSLLVIPKGKSDIRLVVDLRGPNKCIHRTPFKMPTMESILLELHGAKFFSTIDLTNAFFHIVLDENSRHLTNFFAGESLYRCCRLPFGLTNAPDIFQEVMQTIVLAGCNGTVNYQDDVLVFGSTKEEHDQNLREVMKRLDEHNKVALAMVWGVERFSVYLLSIDFTIRTDAESNEFIFGGLHRIGKRAVSRAEAWALRLQPYNFKVARVSGEKNVADALSRLVVETQSADSFDDGTDKHLLYLLDTGKIEFTWDEIESEAEKDSELVEVCEAIKTGHWDKHLKRYESESKSLRVLGALVFNRDRVILPHALRKKALVSAHQGHMGAASMKKILRNYFWWPGMAKQVEVFVQNCETCIRMSRKNPPIPLTSRILPDGPWEVLQVDFFSFKDCGSGEFLVVVDTYSRYLHVVEVRTTDANCTNEALCRIFEVWGYPLTICSDNGPPFQGDTFVKTWEDRGVKIQKSIPLSAQSNGAVERQNKGLKDVLTAAKLDKINWKLALEKYLHMHNKVRPLSRLGVTPFKLLVGWRFRGTFPFLWETISPQDIDRTDIREKDAASKLDSKIYADRVRGAVNSDITVGDNG
ncbi:uncharacterized protein LOC134222440 [Armigeres subalbatus]|uniref:uncharacterized protein LOC134222440 n=1 Tax=Armigeres subalbatus TaxID=124917 RepID=UPI002ED5257D